MGSNLETITITVLKKTADTIKQHSKDLHLSLGEVVDRITVDLSTEDPCLASMLVIEYMLTITKNQTEQQVKSTILHIMTLYLSAITQNSGWASEKTIKILEELKELYEKTLLTLYRRKQNISEI